MLDKANETKQKQLAKQCSELLAQARNRTSAFEEAQFQSGRFGASILFRCVPCSYTKARALARNVPFSISYLQSEEARYQEALSLREDVEILREYTGLTGWMRIIIVGSKRDDLRSSFRRSVKPEEVQCD